MAVGMVVRMGVAILVEILVGNGSARGKGIVSRNADDNTDGNCSVEGKRMVMNMGMVTLVAMRMIVLIEVALMLPFAFPLTSPFQLPSPSALLCRWLTQ